MAVNTPQLGDGQFVTMSSISVTGGPSRATLQGQDVVATSSLSAVGSTTLGTVVVQSTASVVGATTLGTLNASTGTFTKLANSGVLISSATTNQSAATAKLIDGQIIFSVRSLSTNGGLLIIRSGNSAWGIVTTEIG